MKKLARCWKRLQRRKGKDALTTVERKAEDVLKKLDNAERKVQGRQLKPWKLKRDFALHK